MIQAYSHLRTSAITNKDLTFYHGTDSESFKEFNPSLRKKEEVFWNPLGEGMYATDQEYFAQYFGKYVHPITIPAGAKYKRINQQTWESTGNTLVMQSLSDALKEAKEKDFEKKIGLSFKMDLGRVLSRNSPYEGLVESSELVRIHFGDYVANLFEKYLPIRSNQKFKKYDFIVFTNTNDVLGYQDNKGNIKSALEVVIFNPKYQRTAKKV